MVGLGVVGDVPPNTLQPPLADGIHLRWASAADKAFPWYGYYLFRREHRPGKPVCFANGLRGLSAGPVGTTRLATAMAVAVSDEPLVLSDSFAPSGAVELELAGRTFVQLLLEPSWWARRMEVKVAIPKDAQTGPRRTCVDFRRGIESGPSPRTLEGATFAVVEGRERARPGIRAPGTVVRRWETTTGALSGLDCGAGLEIELPCEAAEVDILTSHDAEPPTFEALDERGRVVGRATSRQPVRVVETIRLRARGMRRVVVRCKQGGVALHELCFVCPGVRAAIDVDAFDGSTRLARRTASGQPGQVQTVSFELDRLTRVKVSGGLGALVDVCVVPVAQDARSGWAPVPKVGG